MPHIEKSLTEIKKERIEDHIKDLERSVKSCSPKALRQIYILGEEKVAIRDARRIGMLIARFELDCECIIKQI